MSLSKTMNFFTRLVFSTALILGSTGFAQSLEDRVEASAKKMVALRAIDSNNDGLFVYRAEAPTAFRESMKLLAEVASSTLGKTEKEKLTDRILSSSSALYIHAASAFVDSDKGEFLPESSSFWEKLLNNTKGFFKNLGKSMLRDGRSIFFTLLDSPRAILPRGMRWKPLSDESLIEDFMRKNMLKDMLGAIQDEMSGKKGEKTPSQEQAVAFYKLLVMMKDAEPHRFGAFNALTTTGYVAIGTYLFFFPLELGPLTGTSADFWRGVEMGTGLAMAGARSLNSGMGVNSTYKKLLKTAKSCQDGLSK